jgi:hypothetical protein
MVEAKWLKAAQWLSEDKCFVQLPRGDLMHITCHDTQIFPKFDVAVSGEIIVNEYGLSKDEVDTLWNQLVAMSSKMDSDEFFSVDDAKEKEMIENENWYGSTYNPDA